MKRISALLLFCIAAVASNGQAGWTWTALPDMPEETANNAVVEGMCDDTLCVYSFTGIQADLSPADIHLKSFQYNTVSQEWTTLADVPDVQGKIAAGASYVNGLIYVIGGYYVEENFSESSSDDVHRFDPNSGQWLTDGATIPVQVDDHVQAVWRDSLIYVVTGWSDNGNVPDVQVYDTYLDQWTVGTPTPNTSQYKAFGASGVIIGDTIYYHGGVNGTFSFSANSRMRKGVIDADNPQEIEWSVLENSPSDDGYRAAACSYEDRLFWIGGAGIAYNFDALAYSNDALVEPTPRILTYYAGLELWEEGLGSPQDVMDLRGVAQVSENEWIICGGIGTGQEVLTSTWLLTYDPSVDTPIIDSNPDWLIYPNPVSDQLRIKGNSTPDGISIIDQTGRLVMSVAKTRQVDVSRIEPGHYSCCLEENGQHWVLPLIIR